MYHSYVSSPPRRADVFSYVGAPERQKSIPPPIPDVYRKELWSIPSPASILRGTATTRQQPQPLSPHEGLAPDALPLPSQDGLERKNGAKAKTSPPGWSYVPAAPCFSMQATVLPIFLPSAQKTITLCKSSSAFRMSRTRWRNLVSFLMSSDCLKTKPLRSKVNCAMLPMPNASCMDK